MRVLFVTSLLFFSRLALAADEKNIPTLTNEPVGVTGFLTMFFGLALIVVLIIGLAWFMRRMGNLNGLSQANLKVISGISVGQRERIVLVQAGETQLLVGIGPGQIRTLHVLDEPIQEIKTNTKTGTAAGFAEKLQAALKNKGQP